MTSSTITIHDVEQRTPEWHALRSGRVTASNAMKLLIGGKEYAMAPTDFKGNRWTRRGTFLESEAIEIYERIKQTDVLLVGFVTNSEYPECGASPDGITDLYIEVKCFNENKHKSIVDISTVPVEVMAQVQFGMMVTDLSNAHLVLYNPDLDSKDAFKIIEIARDDRIIANIKRKIETA
jgi:hypothetical protein